MRRQGSSAHQLRQKQNKTINKQKQNKNDSQIGEFGRVLASAEPTWTPRYEHAIAVQSRPSLPAPRGPPLPSRRGTKTNAAPMAPAQRDAETMLVAGRWGIEAAEGLPGSVCSPQGLEPVIALNISVIDPMKASKKIPWSGRKSNLNPKVRLAVCDTKPTSVHSTTSLPAERLYSLAVVPSTKGLQRNLDS